MSKKKRSRSRSDADISTNANHRLSDPRREILDRIRRLTHVSVVDTRPLRKRVLAVEDRRSFHPEKKLRPARALKRSQAAPVAKATKRERGRGVVPSKIRFAVPKKVALCVRREQRREVLFAKGRGGGRHRPPTKNWYSDVSCKR